LKTVYALVFCLFSFAASAQTLESSLAPYYVDNVDCLGEMPEQSTISNRIATEPPIELLCEIMLLDAHGTGVKRDNAEDLPVGAIQSEALR
jgi:hypothetical protein